MASNGQAQGAKPLDNDDAAVKRVAYLGPPGTYGNQAANAFLPYIGDQKELIPCPTIPSIYTTPAEYLVMPLQNAIHGPVIETLDCLLGINAEAGPSTPRRGLESYELDEPVIIGDLDLPIRHCLVAKAGVTIEEIKWVRSHEQALGQSSKFLSERLPLAKIEQWPSTAGAALSLLDPSTYPADGGAGAAICSKAVVELYPGRLEVLYEGTQSIANNYTRFLLLSRIRQPVSSQPPQSGSSFFVTDHLEDISSLNNKSTLRAIHSRPASIHGSVHAEISNGSARSGFYPLRYLVETSAAGTSGGARQIGQAHLHVSLP